MHKTTRLKINDLNQHLVCVLCAGYFIDATCIIECLHSFCKSCITKYLEGNKCCPICDVQVHKTRPLVNLRPDKTLQMLVYKLIPGLYKKEMLRRREFYESHPDDAPSTTSPNATEERGEADPDKYMTREEPEMISLMLQHCDRLPLPSNSICRRSPGTTKKTSDRRYLLCPAGVTIAHLKKFIRSKFDIQVDYQIELFYHGDETLPEDYTLADVAYVYGWTRKEPLAIFYVVLDKREICLNLPTPSQSAPIVIQKRVEIDQPHQDSLSEPDVSSIDKVEEEVFNKCEDIRNLVSPAPTKSDEEDIPDSKSASPVSPSLEELGNAEHPTVNRHERKHSHKKKKKKKKHKRSKSKEEKSPEEPIRSVIKVRISKDKISPCILNGTPYLDTTPDQSVDDQYDSPCESVTDAISTKVKDVESSNGVCISDTETVLNDDVHDAGHTEDGESKIDHKISSTDAATTSLASTGNNTLNNCDSDSTNGLPDASIDHSVCSSLESRVATSGSKLHVHPKQAEAGEEHSVIDNATDDLSFLSDSDQDSFFDSSQTKHKEYTCEISRDGKVVFHSSKPSGSQCKLISSMDIVVEENPPQIIVVDKDAELKMDKLKVSANELDTSANNGENSTNGKLLHSVPNGGNNHGNVKKDITNKDTFNKTIHSLEVEGRVEVEPPVLVEVDESGTLIDSPSPMTGGVALDKHEMKHTTPGVSSPSEANCTANEPMNCARTSAHAFQFDSKRSEGPSKERIGVPLNVHSSLSPPNGNNSLKRVNSAESGTPHKQVKLHSKNTGCKETPSSEPNTIISDPNGHRVRSKQNTLSSQTGDAINCTDKARPYPGVYSSLSPPDCNGNLRIDNQRSDFGHIGISRVDTRTSPDGTPLRGSSMAGSLKMLHRQDRSHSRKPNKRGPLKERPITLPVSHTTTIGKTCGPAPKPRVNSHVPNFPLFQPHIHPSLSAISAVAAHMQSEPHVPAQMKQLRLMCGEMGISAPPLPTPTLPQAYPIQSPGFMIANSRHFLSPIFSPPLPARSLPSPLSPTRASPLSPNHFGPISPAHFGPMSPPRMSPPSMPALGIAPHLQVPGYDSPLELTTRKAQDRHRDCNTERNGSVPTVALPDRN